METPPKIKMAPSCKSTTGQFRQLHVRQLKFFVWGKHVISLRGFSHPDYTVGFGITPNQPVLKTGSQTAA